MKTLKYTFLLVLIIASSACQKVIKIKTKPNENKIVIVGTISTAMNVAEVKISKSVNLNAPNKFPQISGAIVKITDNLGTVTNLTETVAGTYSAPLISLIGRTYNLEVTYEGKSYTSSSTIPALSVIDTIASFTGFGGQIATIPFHNDAAGIANYWAFRVTINGVLQNQLLVNDDQFSDGKNQSQPIFGNFEIIAGDSVDIEIQCFDEGVHTYLDGLAAIADGGSNSASPSNPISNITGGCLGYFKACSSMTKGIRIPL